MKILFAVSPEDSEAAVFVHSLHDALTDCNITITQPGLRTLLFEARKYDVVHFFVHPENSSQFVKKFAGKVRSVQTFLSRPESNSHFDKLLFGERIIVFSQGSKRLIESRVSGTAVEVIPPCLQLPDPTQLTPPSVVREKYNATDRTLVVSLNDMSNQKEFDAFLYIAREYNRRDTFRFLIPLYDRRKGADSWREKLQYSLGMEKLDSVSILTDESDIHSLIDAADLAVLIDRHATAATEFPPRAVEALLRGRPLICFAQSPISEIVREFQSKWVASNTEDFVRESRDIQKEEARMEEISTELARFARSRFDPQVVGRAYQLIYESLQ
jgi:glycosyltransferase involved in cell wall biosynthesis